MWSNQWLIKCHCIYAFVDFCYDNEGIQRIEASRSEFSTVGLHNPTIGLFLGRSSFRFLAQVIQNSVGVNLAVDVWSLGCIVLDMATTKTTLEPLISPSGFMLGRYNPVRFLKSMQKAGLYAHLRIGPYVCVEWNFGGLSEKHVMETPLLSLSLEVFDGRLDDPISVSIRGGLYSSFHFFGKNSLSGKFVHPSGVEHYLSDNITALRNCYGDKQLFTPFVCECMPCVQCVTWAVGFLRGLRGHAKENILLATKEYTSYNSNVMMCGML
ncbi:hypothetical protein DVH24_010734 [Malus domestica]|uniref:beta-galactosidase n=1 Tax=Malus domestica TaxID=3750 RepID=A0A498JR41_MALDO|nr:hypothetical protein DVH24_010734 [Malus domestica]